MTSPGFSELSDTDIHTQYSDASESIYLHSKYLNVCRYTHTDNALHTSPWESCAAKRVTSLPYDIDGFHRRSEEDMM